MASRDLQNQILSHVRVHGGIANLADAAKEWGTKVESIRAVLFRLRAAKKIHYLLHEHVRIVDPTLLAAPPRLPPPPPPPTVPAVPEAKRRGRKKTEPPPPFPRPSLVRRVEEDDEELEDEVVLAEEEEEEEPRPKPKPIGDLSDEEETRLLRIMSRFAAAAEEEKEETEDA